MGIRRSKKLVGEENKDTAAATLLENAVDNLYEKRGSTREKALSSIINAFSVDLLHHELVLEKKHVAALLHGCLKSIKRGSSKEVSLACHAIALVALYAGHDDQICQQILNETLSPISEALINHHPAAAADSSNLVSLVKCLAIISYVAVQDVKEKGLQVIWQKLVDHHHHHPKAVKPSADTITALVTAWSFLLTTMSMWRVKTLLATSKPVSYLSSLLEKDDRGVRIAAGEALAVIIEMECCCCFDKFSKEQRGLMAKVVNQMHRLSVEPGGKGCAKKDLTSQRKLFKDVLRFIEDGCGPESSVQIGCTVLSSSTWSHMIRINFLRHFLGTAFNGYLQWRLL